MDDAYIGGARSGKCGRGAAGKTPFVAAVAVTSDGKPDQIILRRVVGFRKTAIVKLADAALAPGASVVSDALAYFAAVTGTGCTHAPVKTGSGAKAAKNPRFKSVNTVLGNIKAAMVGTYRAVRAKHVPRYLAEFEYRFNRRCRLETMIDWLAYLSLKTLPMPYRLLKLADVYGADTGFRDALTELGLSYAMGIDSGASVWAPGTGPAPPKEWSGKGRPPARLRRDEDHQPVTVKALELILKETHWQTINWREGVDKAMKSRFARLPVHPADKDYRLAKPRPEEWLVIEWPEGEDEPAQYWLYLCSIPIFPLRT